MRLEDLKNEFPAMPKEMREMIEREVEKQVKTEHPQFKRGRKAAGRTIAASIAAVMLLGTTAFAGVRAYRLRQEPTGAHGVEVKITNEDDTVKAPAEIPAVKMEVGYLPEGMVETEEGKYSYESDLYKGGISLLLYKMDTGDEKFEVQHDDISLSENFTVNGYEGVYLESPNLYEDDISFNQRIYVAYTDVHYVLEMYVASDVTKEEAMKIAEGIQLVPALEGEGAANVSACNWSAYQAGAVAEEQYGTDDLNERYTVDETKMANTHAVGESFPSDREGLTLKVKDVQVADDISLLDPALVDEELKNETDENGRLLPADIQYIKEGNADSLSEVIRSRQAAQKLVYVTVEYTNEGEEELSDVLFMGNLARITKKDGQMQMSSGYSYEEPKEGDTWTYASNRGLSAFWEMYYYDVFGGERHNNYIESILPGETKTVHMGWIVTEEELNSLYLSLDTYGGMEFSDSSLELGYVDVRQ